MGRFDAVERQLAHVIVVVECAYQVDKLAADDDSERVDRVFLGLAAVTGTVLDRNLAVREQTFVDCGLDLGIDLRRKQWEGARDGAELSGRRRGREEFESALPAGASCAASDWSVARGGSGCR